jgi:Protein of unknown function (DUF3396)
MSTFLDGEDADISRIFCIRDKDGRVALRIGLVATMFFAESWTRPVRETVVDAAEEYIRQFRPYLRWAEHPRTMHMHPIDSKKVPFPRSWLPQHEDNEDWSFGFHGGETNEATSEFQVSAMGSNAVEKDPGYFQMYLPLTWFAEHPGTFQEFVLGFARRLRPLSGYAGIGVQEALSLGPREPYMATVRQIAERFPGLEIESNYVHTIHVGEGIKGVNWLTLLGDRWVQQIGGLDYLRTRLSDDFELTPYDGGLMIQAGPKPQIGDVTTNRWPRHYVTLAKVLKPIQIKEHYAFHLDNPDPKGAPRLDAISNSSEAWLFRFDGK